MRTKMMVAALLSLSVVGATSVGAWAADASNTPNAPGESSVHVYSQDQGTNADTNTTGNIKPGTSNEQSTNLQTGQNLNENEQGLANDRDLNNNGQMQGQALSQSEQTAIRGRIAGALNKATSRDGFNDLVSDLAKDDQSRINESSYSDLSGLNDAAQKFQTAFRDKYHQDFDLKSSQLDFLRIRGTDRDAYVGFTGLDRQGRADWANGNANLNQGDRSVQTNVQGQSDINRDYNNAQASNLHSDIGMPRGDAKHPNSVRVDVSKSDGTVATNVPVPANSVENPSLNVKTDQNGVPQVVASGQSGLRETHAEPTIPVKNIGDTPLASGQSVSANASNTTGAQANSEESNETTAQENMEANGSQANGGVGVHDRMNETHGMMAMRGAGTLHLTKQPGMGNDWQIDIPNNVSKQQLAQSLQTHLTQLADNSQQWPSSADQAYRHISRNLVQAITHPSTTGLSSER